MANPPPPPAWPDRPQAVSTTHTVNTFGGFWIRFVAYFIDGFVLMVPIAIICAIFFVVLGVSWDEDDENKGAIVAGAFALVGIIIVISWLYEALMTSSERGATLGKMMLGLRIVRADGARLSFGRATARHFLKTMITPLVPFAIGYLLAAFTDRKRALHDIMADTLVIKRTAYFQGETTMSNVPTSGPAAPPPPPPVWDAHPAGSTAVAYGGFWIRLVAYIIDAILLSIASGIIGTIFGVNIFNPDPANYSGMSTGISILMGLLYFSLMESSERGATVGKMAMGLRVVTDKGERLSFPNAIGRYFAKIISAIILCIGFIMIGFTDRKRGLHDMIAGTLVIKNR
jgi:uncharacterized RDD family membrane protein YckC